MVRVSREISVKRLFEPLSKFDLSFPSILFPGFYLKRVRLEDAGRYICVSANSAGVAEKTFSVNVTGMGHDLRLIRCAWLIGLIGV